MMAAVLKATAVAGGSLQRSLSARIGLLYTIVAAAQPTINFFFARCSKTQCRFCQLLTGWPTAAELWKQWFDAFLTGTASAAATWLALAGLEIDIRCSSGESE